MIKAGFSIVEVTPPLGTYMSGYFAHRYAKGIMDPLYLNAIALSDGENTALIITADFLGIRDVYATPIRTKIAEKVGINADNIIITCLHQHTSICLRDDPGGANNVLNDHTYLNVLYRKFCDVAMMATNDMSEATLGLAEMQALEQLSFIRRFRMKDGSTKTNASRNPDMLGPIGQPDNTVRLLRFVREGKGDIAMVNFSTHPDTVGGSLFCPDWPGYTRNYVEADHEDVSCILINGVQGDSNHISYTEESKGPGGPHAKYMARVIADTVNQIWDKTEDCKIDKVCSSVEYVYQITRTDGAEHYDDCAEKYPLVQEKLIDAKCLDYVGGAGGARRIVQMRFAPLFQKIAVSVISLGKINFVGFGGEPFTHYATAVREALPEKHIVALCCANGYEGYLPTKEAYSEGGYEAVTSPFHPSLEDDCVNLAVEIINKLNLEE